jgi:hypothetical protein
MGIFAAIDYGRRYFSWSTMLLKPGGASALTQGHMLRTVLPAVIIAASSIPAWAQTAFAQGDDARYSFSRTEEGYLRLDGRTGQVSVCTRKIVGWACQLVPDERSALEAEIARLQGENAIIKKELLEHHLSLPGAVSPPAPVKPDEPRPPLPGQAEVNKLIAMMDQVWRRLVDMVWTLQRDILKKT